MRALLLIALTGILFLVSCAPSDLPPEPGAPGVPVGQAFAYQQGYAPPADVYADEQVFFLAPPVVNIPLADTTFDLDVDVKHLGGFIYKFGYYYTTAGWQVYEFAEDTVGTSNWIADSATYDPTYNKAEFNDGENYIIAYSCKKYDGQWRCGCQSQGGTCGLWMLQSFLLRGVELPPDPPTPGQLQTTFVSMSPSNQLVKEGDDVFIYAFLQSSQLQTLTSLADVLAATVTSIQEVVTTSVANQFQIDKINRHVGYGRYLQTIHSASISGTEFPIMLAPGTFDEDVGNTKNNLVYTQELDLWDGSGQLIFTQDDDDAPIAGSVLRFQDLTTMYRYNLDFDVSVDYDATSLATASDDLLTAKLDILGKTYTISGVTLNTDNSVHQLNLHADAITLSLAQNDPVSVNIAGTTHTFELLDVHETENKCSISINGAASSIDVGLTRGVGGISIAVSDAIDRSATSGIDTCDVILSDTVYVLEDGFEAKLNGFDIDGSFVEIVSGVGTLGEIALWYEPADDIYLEVGETFTDPIFGAFRFVFDGMTNEETELIDFNLTPDWQSAVLTFLNKDGKEVKLEWSYDGNTIVLGTHADRTYLEGQSCSYTTSLDECVGARVYGIASNGLASVLEIASFDTVGNKITFNDLTDGTTSSFDFDKSLFDIDQAVNGAVLTLTGDATTGELVFTEIDSSPNGAETSLGATIVLADVFDGITSGTLFTLTEETLDGYGGNVIDFPVGIEPTNDRILINDPVVSTGAFHAQNIPAVSLDSVRMWFVTNWSTAINYRVFTRSELQIDYPDNYRYGNVAIQSIGSSTTSTEEIAETVELNRISDVSCTQDNVEPFSCYLSYQGTYTPAVGTYTIEFTSEIDASEVNEGSFEVIPETKFTENLILQDIGSVRYLSSSASFSTIAEYYFAHYQGSFIWAQVTVDITESQQVVNDYVSTIGDRKYHTESKAYPLEPVSIDGHGVYVATIDETDRSARLYAWVSGTRIIEIGSDSESSAFTDPIDVVRAYLKKFPSDLTVETPAPPQAAEYVLVFVAEPSQHVKDLKNDLVVFTANQGVTFIGTTNTVVDDITELNDLLVVFINEDVNGDEHTLIIIGQNSPAAHVILAGQIKTYLDARALEPDMPPQHVTILLNTDIYVHDLAVVFPGVSCSESAGTTLIGGNPADFCFNSDTNEKNCVGEFPCQLVEHSCKDTWDRDLHYAAQETVTCEIGCANGACLPPAITCTEFKETKTQDFTDCEGTGNLATCFNKYTGEFLGCGADYLDDACTSADPTNNIYCGLRTCEDSDGGSTLDELGTAIGYPNAGNLLQPFSREDTCNSDTQIVEYTCNPTVNGPAVTGNVLACSNGCLDGVCLPAPAAIECTETDGGIDYAVAGSTTGVKAWWEPIQENVFTETDSCTTICSGSVGSGLASEGPCLIEFNCASKPPEVDPIYAAFSVETCANGCIDGACVTASTCVDSDGDDVFTAGNVTKGIEIFKDECAFANQVSIGVVEYTCSSTGEVLDELISCECENGACK